MAVICGLFCYFVFKYVINSFKMLIPGCEFEVSMDAKGRFLLPSGYRKLLPEDAEMKFNIKKDLNKGCIKLYTSEAWQRLAAKITKLNPLHPKVEQIRTLFFYGTMNLELDSAGRLLIPKSWKDHAGLEKEVTFVAQGDVVEIWDTKRYNDYVMQNQAQYNELLNEAFGGNLLDPFGE